MVPSEIQQRLPLTDLFTLHFFGINGITISVPNIHSVAFFFGSCFLKLIQKFHLWVGALLFSLCI